MYAHTPDQHFIKEPMLVFVTANIIKFAYDGSSPIPLLFLKLLVDLSQFQQL